MNKERSTDTPEQKKTLGTKAKVIAAAAVVVGASIAGGVFNGNSKEVSSSLETQTNEQVVPNSDVDALPIPGSHEAERRSEKISEEKALKDYEKALAAEDYSRMSSNPGDVFVIGTEEDGKILVIVETLVFEASDDKDYVIYKTDKTDNETKYAMSYDEEDTTTFFLMDSEGGRFSIPLVVDGANNPHASEGRTMAFDNPSEISQYVQEQGEKYPDAHFTSIGKPLVIERQESNGLSV